MSKKAIISVYYKDNLDKFIPYLENNDYQIYSTGGTFTYIKNILKDTSKLINISEYTNSPEICNGRVKTLHPKIFGGLLGLRNNENHVKDLQSIDGIFFDLVLVNLYPFEETIKNTNNESDIIEQIDIGGHSLIRASVKNYKYVTILTSPEDYQKFIDMNTEHNKNINLYFAKKAISSIMNYDIAINNWFYNNTFCDEDKNHDNNENNNVLNSGDVIGRSYVVDSQLKYGLNPYMKPSYIFKNSCSDINTNDYFKILNGKPGYTNLLDANNAIRLVLEIKKLLGKDCCTSFKHTSPAGVSICNNFNYSNIEGMKQLNNENNNQELFSVNECLFLNARHIDPKSSFGDFIAYSGIVDVPMANKIKKYVSDGIIAFGYEPEALKILKEKKKGSYNIIEQRDLVNELEFRDVNGFTLVQPSNNEYLTFDELKNSKMINELLLMKNDKFDLHILNDMILGFITLKYTQSNSICFVYKGNVIGIGAGQQNRVDCVKLAGNKAMDWLERNNIDKNEVNLTLVSDAFFPFADNIDVAHNFHTKYIAQPGGSIRDTDIEDACHKYNIAMIYTNKRVFTH